MTNLRKYQQWLLQHNIDNPVSGRPNTPADFDFKTLWIPQTSGRRIATLDLNHEIGVFASPTMLVGYNGNCGTAYYIIEVPKEWAYDNIVELAILVCKKTCGYRKYPVEELSGDNMPIILDILNEQLINSVQ